MGKQKQEFIDFLLSKGIKVEAEYSTVMVKAQTKEWSLANEKFECVRLAEEQGHKSFSHHHITVIFSQLS